LEKKEIFAGQVWVGDAGEDGRVRVCFEFSLGGDDLM
jgi:hypothetical protein